MNIINKTAIVILSYSDFESLEISLSLHSKYSRHNADIFILQNGRGTYDCERTYRTARRYETLYPKQIKVIDWIKPQKPYFAIKELLSSELMKNYEYICKMDDDTFPITDTWLNDLCKCYEDSYGKYGDNLAYITGLINNNPWGFARVLKIMNLEELYFKEYSRAHYVGLKDYNYGKGNNLEIFDNDKISDSAGGTIWRHAYIARWIHEKTTLNRLEYIKMTSDKFYEEIDNGKRYSINCMLFKKEFWNKICEKTDRRDADDEHLCFLYSYNNDKKIISNLKVPLVHLFFFTQREENKDLIPVIRDYYSKVIKAPYPISICENKEYENENRLRFLENAINKNINKNNRKNISDFIFSITKNDKYRIITILGIKITLKL